MARSLHCHCSSSAPAPHTCRPPHRDVLPPCLETSAARNSGLGNVLQHVAGVRAFYEKEAKPTAGKKGSDARFMRMLQGN